MRCLEIEEYLENLKPEDYDQEDVSPQTTDYNCIAWAAGITNRPWWPVESKLYDWPDHLPREEVGKETIDNFVRAFETLGYKVCKSPKLQKGVEKVAIYTGPSGNPLHAARQLENGTWWSKCGDYEDIKHKTLACFEGKNYGKVSVILRRRRDGKPFLFDRLKKVFGWT